MAYISNIGLKPTSLNADGSISASDYNSFGEYKMMNNTFPSLLLEQTGTGTFTNNTNRVTMSATSGQYAIITSKQFHPYFNGRSLVVEMTSAGFGAATNVEKSIGYISSTATTTYNTGLDGFRLYKSTADVYAVEVWRNGTRIQNILQSSWYDKLDGTGPSGMNITWSNFNVFKWDFLYLGGTALRLFVMYNGEFRLVMQYNHANTDTAPFLMSPNKPIRYEIRSSTGSGNMDFICATVGITGQPDQGTTISVQGPIAGITPLSAGISYAICGVRKASTQRDIYAEVTAFEGIISSDDFINLELRLNPTVAGTFTYSAVTNTPLEAAVGAVTNTVTGGTVIGNTWFSLNMNNRANIDSILAHLNSTINNTMDTVVLCATPALGSTNVKATGSIQIVWYNQYNNNI